MSKVKVICIDDHTLSSGVKIKGLTIGKTYDVEQQLWRGGSVKSYRIIDDDGLSQWYTDDIIITLEKWRDIQLEEILKK